MRRRGALLAVGAAALALGGPAAAQRDPTDADRFLRRIDRLPAGGADLVREFGVPEWHARVLTAAQRYWIEEAGRPGASPATVSYRSQLADGFNFDRYDLQRVTDRDGRPSWTGRWVHVRRVEITAAASRTFPLDPVWRAYQRHGRNGASPAFRQELQRLLPDPERVARTVLTRTEATDSRSCRALAAAGERALALRARQPSGEPGSTAADRASAVLTVRDPNGAGGVAVFQGGLRSQAGAWQEAMWRGTGACWRLQSINNPDRR